MSTTSSRITQGPFEAVVARGMIFDWRAQDADDHSFFVTHPTAPYRLRPWRLSDDRGHDEANLYDMAGVTIVFRGGCRSARFYAQKDRDPLPRATSDAQCFLWACPEIGADGDLPVPRLAS